MMLLIASLVHINNYKPSKDDDIIIENIYISRDFWLLYNPKILRVKTYVF